MKCRLTALFIVMTLAFAQAQSKKWTLEECVVYAVENNLTVAQFELDLENATIDKSDAIGNLLPGLDGQLSASGNTGLSFDPTNNRPVTTTIFTSTGNLTSTLTLFDGLRNFNRINRAKMNAIANQYRLENLKDDIRVNVANSYLQLISNKENLKVAKAQYAVTEQDLKRITELVESGVVPRGDLLDIQATAANQEQQIVNAEGQVLIAKIGLAQLLQISDYDNFEVADEEFVIPPSDILSNSPRTIFAKALEFRNDIKFSATNVELAQEDLKISKGALYPTVNAFFNYNTRYSDQFFDPISGDLIPLRDQIYINDGISFGAQMNIPIFNGFSVRNNINRSEIAVERAKLQFEQDKLTLENTVNQAYVAVQTTAKAYEASEKTLEARRLAYEYAKERFEVGLLNAFVFSQAQAQVDNAEAEVVRTKYEYIFRLKILEFYFGIPIALN